MWYEKSGFRNLVDMHIADREGSLEKFDADAYADNMAKAGVDGSYVYASNCLGLCLYPSKYGYRHRITNKRDLFGETVAALKKRGIAVIGYLNSWSTACYDRHPEWRITSARGKGTRDNDHHGGRYGQCCVNSPYRDYFYKLVTELCETYDLDGFWTDMVGFFNPVCFCKSCKEQYEKNGKKIPTVINWDDPAFVDYINFKYKSMTSYAQGICDAARAANPKVSVGLQCASWSLGCFGGYLEEYYATMDYCAGDFYGEHVESAVHSRVLNNLTPKRPFEFMTSRCYDLSYHTMTKPMQKLLASAYNSLLSCGSFMFIDAIDPDGAMNPLLYERIRPVGKSVKKYLPFVDYNARIIADAAVYFNFDSMVDLSDNGKPIDDMTAQPPLFATFKNISKTFLERHITFDILTRANIDRLQDFKVVILPGLAFISQDEAAAFKRYVENGGALYVSGETGLRETGGVKRGDFMLGDITGVRCDGSHELTPSYFAPVHDGDPLFGDYSRKYPFMIKAAMADVSLAGGEMLAEAVLPACSSNDNINFVTAISDPPVNYTGKPSLVYNAYGKGRTLYSAGALENSAVIETADFFAALIEKLADGFSVAVEAPSCVYHSSVKKTDGNILCMLFNAQDLYPPVPVDGIVVRMKTDRPAAVVKLPDGTDVDYSYDNGCLTIKADKLDLFDMYEIRFKI